MSTTILWYILGGFILGFLVSTLWESLYYRGWRLERYYNEHVLGRSQATSSTSSLGSTTQNTTYQNREFTSQELRSREAQSTESQSRRDNTGQTSQGTQPRAAETRTSLRNNEPDKGVPDKKNADSRFESGTQRTYTTSRQRFTPNELVSNELASNKDTSTANRVNPSTTDKSTSTEPVTPFSLSPDAGKQQPDVVAEKQPQSSRESTVTTRTNVTTRTSEARSRTLPGTSVQPKRTRETASYTRPEQREFESAVPLETDLTNPFSGGVSVEELVGVIGGLSLPTFNHSPEADGDIEEAKSEVVATSVEQTISEQSTTVAQPTSLAPAATASIATSQPTGATPTDEDTLELTINRLQERALRVKQPAEPTPTVATAAQKTVTEATPSTQSSNYPDDLSQIDGIGLAFQQRLYEAGFFTWHQISQSQPDELRAATRAGGYAKVEAWIEQAKALATEHHRTNVLFDGPTPSDFRKISGVGASTIHELLKSDIFTYRDLSRSSIKKLTTIFEQADVNPTAETFRTWMDTAKDLMAETKRAKKNKKGTSSKKTSAE